MVLLLERVSPKLMTEIASRSWRLALRLVVVVP